MSLNFAMVALDIRVIEGRSLRGQVRELFIPLLPGQSRDGRCSPPILAVAYTNVGFPVLFGCGAGAPDLPVT